MARGYGTHKTAFKDLAGLRFGRWTVISRGPTKFTRIHWNCVCDCGTFKEVSGCHLARGKSTNCGCLRPERTRAIRLKHGKSDTVEHNIWMAMIHRCRNEDGTAWHNYGGRGISVCQRWLDNFESFLSDMGQRPSPQHSIDRIDVNGNYEPSNCRWATKKEQSRNQRKNIIVDMDGRPVSLAEACETTGVNYGAAKWRVHAGYDWRGI